MSFAKLSRLVTRFRSKLKHKMNPNDTPRFVQEQKDIFMSMIASTYRKNRLRTPSNDRSSLDSIYDKSISELEDKLVPSMINIELRRLVQEEFGPEVTKIFHAFDNVEKRIDGERLSVVKHALRKDYEDALILLKKCDNVSKANFGHRKRGAIQDVVRYKGWNEVLDDISPPFPDDERPKNFDDFGNYTLISDEQVIRSLRHAQILNLTKTALLREQLGYSTLAFRSTIPSAGKGVFLDGKAMAGSVVAFFPGSVWPREYLIEKSAASNFEDDDNYQLSIRYDDIVIDSRLAPYNILDANPWGIAHIANHPSPDKKPNCRVLMLNYTVDMGITPDLRRFIPNTYAKRPWLMTQTAAFDREDILMHGLMLVTIKDVENEELFFDYRFNQLEDFQYPDWYTVCDQEEVDNRWSNE